jgi:hypothetical protein
VVRVTITRAQVADLRPGDVVEMRFPSGASLRGPLTEVNFGAGLGLGIVDVGWSVRLSDGTPAWALTDLGATLTVVSRAPRRLYVNHPRTKPVMGDIVRDREGDPWLRFQEHWSVAADDRTYSTDELREYAPLSLLWDGETGQVVQ